jgi:hypothetical protein
MVRHERKADGVFSLNCDIISPVADLLTLREEFDEPRRDLFGLVEARRSLRFNAASGDGVFLRVPWFDHLALYLGDLLGLPRRASSYPFSVAVTSDVDYIDGDDFPPVLEWLARHGVERPTFYLFGGGENGRTRYDPPYDITGQTFLERLRPLQEADVEIGVHSGFLAHDSLSLLREQKDRVEQWLGRKVSGHRAHYLRFAYPRSWRYQQQAGFDYDSSLGYADAMGLRNGACALGCLPQREAENLEPFAILPCMVMDQHFFWPRPVPPEQRSAMIDGLLAEVEKVAGILVLDFHSYTLHTLGYEGWWEPLNEFLSKAAARGGRIAGAQLLLHDMFSKLNN